MVITQPIPPFVRFRSRLLLGCQTLTKTSSSKQYRHPTTELLEWNEANSGIPAGLRQFGLVDNKLIPSSYTAGGTHRQIRGTTAFLSANGTSDGEVWMIDQNEPLGANDPSPGIATRGVFDPDNLANELYDSDQNPSDRPVAASSSHRPSWPTPRYTSPLVTLWKMPRPNKAR